MANIKNAFDHADVEIKYYLFRPDILLKVIGDYTYMYNRVLNEWIETKSFEAYVSSGVSFKALKKETVDKIIEEFNDNILIKQEFTNEDVKEMISGKKKIKVETRPEIVEDEVIEDIFNDDEVINLEGINLKKTKFYERAFYPLIIIILLLISYILIVNS